MTTDGTSKNVFYETFKKYEIITNEEFENLKSINNHHIMKPGKKLKKLNILFKKF